MALLQMRAVIILSILSVSENFFKKSAERFVESRVFAVEMVHLDVR